MKLIPVITQHNEHRFVMPLAADVEYNGHTVKSAPIRFGNNIDLIGLSRPGWLVTTEQSDGFETIAPKISITGITLYNDDTNDVITMSLTPGLPLQGGEPGEEPIMRAQLHSRALLDCGVALHLSASITVNIETGECNAYATVSSGNTFSDPSNDNFLIKDIKAWKPIGFTVDAEIAKEDVAA